MRTASSQWIADGVAAGINPAARCFTGINRAARYFTGINPAARCFTGINPAACGLLLFALAGCRIAAPLQTVNDERIAPAVNQTVARLQKGETEKRPPADAPTTFELLPPPPPGPADGQVAVRIVAHVNGTPILAEEVMSACFPRMLATRQIAEPQRSELRKRIFQEELEHIIDQELIMQEIDAKVGKKNPKVIEKIKEYAAKEWSKWLRERKKQLNLQTDEEFKNAVKSSGMSFEEMRRQQERGVMSHVFMQQMIGPSLDHLDDREHIQEYYQQHLSEFENVDSVRWQDIFLAVAKFSSKEEALRAAEGLAERARQGEDFVALCKQNDQGDSVFRNAEGYGQRRGEIKPTEVEPALFAMEKGQVRVVAAPSGFHVVRVAEREHAGQQPLTFELQKKIKEKLRGEAGARESKRCIARLRNRAKIEIAAEYRK